MELRHAPGLRARPIPTLCIHQRQASFALPVRRDGYWGTPAHISAAAKFRARGASDHLLLLAFGVRCETSVYIASGDRAAPGECGVAVGGI